MSRAALSWRETAALVRHLPSEAAIYGHGWSVEAYLLSDLLRAFTGELHPSDPRMARAEEAQRARLEAGARRAAARRSRLGIKGSVLRKGGDT